ncbi:MAG: NAD(P)H-dependent glycerol-3-phosphate dehydrogenase [Rhodobacter sp.]|nr:NAD(P)H-dependent glycerol-3-phosphate dehydrogenase [Rhodobacter sp.]
MIAILGAGAFGTALAVALARAGHPVQLWTRDAAHAKDIETGRENTRRLPGIRLPDAITATADFPAAETYLLAIPTQSLAELLALHRPDLGSSNLVACCKGVDLSTGLGPSGVIRANVPSATPALLSGPSFAVDIAAGLPTALTIAAADDRTAARLQTRLSTPTLRLYRSTDLTGIELGGALKNVIAIACGITIGAGLGESARAALMTRGYAEMLRFATARGARAETLAGLSGLGDLALTCTSEKSRNFAFGLRLGAEGSAQTTATTEGIATARAVASIAESKGLDMPVTQMVAAVLDGRVTVAEATDHLLARPLRPE